MESRSNLKYIYILKITLSCLIFFFCKLESKGSDWIKTFSDGKPVQVIWVIETYDKGYLLVDNETVYSWLIKTDINGNKLWEKRIGDAQHLTYLWNIEQTIDGGFILGGAFGKYDPNGMADPVILKLNACGELEWCSVINTLGIYDGATRVRPTPEGNYVLSTLYSDPNPLNRLQLFKFDGSGNLLWKHNYHPDSLIWSEDDHDVRVDADGYLISAMCYYPDPGNPTVGYERPYYIKTDTAGNILWWLVYGSGNGYHGFIWDATIKSTSGNYYSTGVHSNICDNSALVKCLGDGQESYYHDFIPGLCPGGYFSSINFSNDTTFISIACGTLNGNAIHRWLTMDTLGVMKTFKEYPSWICGTTHTIRTFDNKFVSVAKVNSFLFYLYKLNSNLEYDSIYTHQYIYDSLCPNGVVSDTINPDCGLIVGINDPKTEDESCMLKVYPNPATARVTVELPECLKTTDKKPGITTSTIYYQWKSTLLEVYDLNGKRLFSKEIPKNQQRLDLDVSGWKREMYYFRLIYHNQIVAGEKVIIRQTQ